MQSPRIIVVAWLIQKPILSRRFLQKQFQIQNVDCVFSIRREIG